MEERAAELLPVEYFHVVFTLPAVFNALALSNKRVVYGLLFKAVARTLLEVAANPKHLGAQIGFLAILHTWGQNLSLHPHLHCVIPGGGLSPDGTRWIGCRPGFFLPVRILSRVFRGKFISLLRRAWGQGRVRGVPDQAAFEALADSAVRHVNGGAKVRRVAGRSKSAAPHRELRENGDGRSAMEAGGAVVVLTEAQECIRTWTSG
jgi:hypothetical protein